MDRKGDVIDTYVAEETERLEQNLMGENRGDSLEDDIPDKQDDDLVF